jgi:radical SAM protein with 4Fe4S-binding SPASM domain
MFKYLLLKVIYDISDVDVVERTRYDMSFKYFLGLTPEETNLINPSSLTKFRRLRLKDMDLLDLLIKKTVSIAIEAGVLKSRTIIVDATHTHSRSNPISAAKSLEYYCKAVIKVVNSVDDSMELPELPKEKKYSSIMTAAKTIVATVEADAATANMPAVKERLNMLKETISDAETRGVISKDADARTGHKTAHSSFFGYKTHIAMSDERIITAATVTSGEKGDGQQLPELIKKTEEAGMEVDSIVADKAYSSKENLKMAKENNMRLSARLSSVIDVDGNSYACHGVLYSKNKDKLKSSSIFDNDFINNIKEFNDSFESSVKNVPEACKKCVATTCIVCPVNTFNISKKESTKEKWEDRAVNGLCEFYQAFGEIDRSIQKYLNLK